MILAQAQTVPKMPRLWHPDLATEDEHENRALGYGPAPKKRSTYFLSAI